MTPQVHRVSSETATTERVLQAVASHENVDPVDLESRLYDAIDPDALDALYDRDGAGVSVAFSYLGYAVSIDEDREITVQK